MNWWLLKIIFPEAQDQFERNLAQSTFSWSEGGIEICSNDGLCPFQREDTSNSDMVKIHRRFLNIFFARTTGPISTKLPFFNRKIIFFAYFKNKITRLIRFAQAWLSLGSVSQVSAWLLGLLIIFTTYISTYYQTRGALAVCLT